MTVIPIQSLRHVPGNVVGVGVGHAWRDVQQHVVGMSPRTDMCSVGVEIDRRGGHLLRVERNGLTLWRVLRSEVVLDGQAAEPVLEMDDQPFAGKYVQRGRRIEIAAGAVPVGRRAANHFIVEQEKVLDRRGYRIEGGLALPRGEADFEHAFLARQRHRLPEFRPDGGICTSLGSLRPGSRAVAFKRHHDSEATDCEQRNQASCMERVVEGTFVHDESPRSSRPLAETKSPGHLQQAAPRADAGAAQI